MSPRTRDLAATPDRVFTRAAVALIGGALALAVAGGAAADLLWQRPARAHALSASAADAARALDGVAESLGLVAGAKPGADLDAARRSIGWSAAALAAAGERRAALGAPALDLSGLDAGFAEVAPEDLPAAAQAQAALIERRLAPKLAYLAAQDAAAAGRALERTRLALAGLAALQVAALALLAWAALAPARRRIAAWVSASRESEREARIRLLHDPLSQLPNATYLHAHLTRLAAAAERSTRHTAVMRLDLDRFRTIRDTLGPRVADEIVRITGKRIRNTLRAGDFAAHLGQDDFVLVASDLEDARAAGAIAQRVQAALTKPFSVQGGARRIGCSVGVAMLADDLPEADRALANAEIALAEAQEVGPGAIRYFRESLRNEIERRETLFAELLSGLDRGELGPFYQPQIDLRTGAFAGFEALVRWRHPTRGLLTPHAFLDFAEATDLTERIGEAVLGQVMAALTAWDAAGLDVPRVGINFAMAQLRDPRLIEKIKWEVERHDVDPSRIAIEVLETVLIKSDEDLMVRNLLGLASAGFHIELDDFGTGHASIQNLRRLNVHRIKIDRSFVAGVETSEEQRTLTSSMVAMARALGIGTLAEGVETAEALATLRELGCDQAQGYHVSKPMAQAETFAWLRAYPGPDATGTAS